MCASQNGHVEAVRVLIEKGAKVEAADTVRIHSHSHTHAHTQSGMTALQYAKRCGKNTVVTVLKKHMAQGKQRM